MSESVIRVADHPAVELNRRRTARAWVKRAVSTCYLYSPGPLLMREMRDRYRLARRNEGHRRVIERRTEPAARILYYHRVNDNNDPFFPAISTALFEQQMQYVARHHKVVTLAGLVDHLDSGQTETVVAINFDDGYRDNYTNAFPILQRYRLPATIFLTTGPIDSGEPLWFEQLASAFKATTKTTIEVEIGTPQRYSVRTLPERLESHAHAYALLRGLSDRERRRVLPNILSALGFERSEGSTSEMLRWDEARLMNGRGIDFGGHTVTHPFLSKTTHEDAAWEAAECKRRVEDELQCSVEHFAYPNGHKEDFSGWNADVVQAAGYRAAVTSIWGLNYPGTPRMQLKRGGPWEEHLAEFALKLDWYELIDA